MNKNYPFKTFLVVALSLPAWSFSPQIHAQEAPDTRVSIVGYGTAKDARQELWKLPTDKAVSYAEGMAQNLYFPYPVNPLSISLTELDFLRFYLAPTPLQGDQLMQNNTYLFGPTGAEPPQVNFYQPPTLKEGEKVENTSPFANVDLNSLMSPLQYTGKQKDSASAFIKAATSLDRPMQVIDLPAMAKSKDTTPTALLADNEKVKRYVSALRAFAATQSVGLSTLYQLYGERIASEVPKPNPASPNSVANAELLKALAAINKPNASQLQVENYMATRRLTDPKWLESLANDSPAALQRQTAILLAEILAELYNNRMTNERVLSVLAAIQLQSNLQMRTLLETDLNSLSEENKNVPKDINAQYNTNSKIPTK